MMNEKSTSELESLSQAWSERVKGIRQMVKNNESVSSADDIIGPFSKNAGPVPTDEELFTETTHQNLPVHEIFVGDEDFYHSINVALSEKSTAHSESKPVLNAASKSASDHNPVPHISLKQSTLIPKILAGSLIATVLIVLVYGLLLSMTTLGIIGPSPRTEAPQTKMVAQESTIPEKTPVLSLDTEHPASLQTARDYYQQAEYLRAAAVYRRLLQNLSHTNSKDPLTDYLELNIALCMRNVGDNESADLFKKVSSSSAPVIRVFANYHLSLLEMEQQQFLSARTRAYRAIGLLDVINHNTEWSRQFRQNCNFLAAETVSREVFKLTDGDKELPAGLWPRFDTENHPLIDLDEESLLCILETGSQSFEKALLEPKIWAENDDEIPLWTVTCNGASIGELMSRFATHAGYDIHWKPGSNSARLRERSVSLYLAGMNARQIITTATGCAGLMASFDDNNVITICDPTDYSSASEQIALLDADAISCWEKYLVAFHDDRFLPNAHFVLGLLKTRQGLAAEALTEYKMIPGRYVNSPLGPGALMCSANLKTELHDYPGAYADLKEAVEQYSGHPGIERTYLALAAAAGKMGRNDEAAKLYSKVYYLNNSPQSQSDAALAAGRIYYQAGDFKEAETWLLRYMNLTEDEMNQNLCQACLMLGKTWLELGNDESACQALCGALAGRLSEQDYAETVNALVGCYIKQGCLVEALQILNDSESRQLSQVQSVQILILKSRVLREMGLTDKAVVLLREREEYVIDDLLKIQIGYELSECYIEQNQLNLAYKKLAAILERVNSGPLMHKTALKLADVCLQLEMDDQVLRIGSQLLSLSPPPSIEEKMLQLIAAVHRKQKNYDRAAAVLMGQWKP